MTTEHASVAELAEFVAHHVFGDEHIDERTAVVHLEGVTDKLRHDGAGARPGLDRLATIGGVETLHLAVDAFNDVRAFFQ